RKASGSAATPRSTASRPRSSGATPAGQFRKATRRGRRFGGWERADRLSLFPGLLSCALLFRWLRCRLRSFLGGVPDRAGVRVGGDFRRVVQPFGRCCPEL